MKVKIDDLKILADSARAQRQMIGKDIKDIRDEVFESKPKDSQRHEEPGKLTLPSILTHPLFLLGGSIVLGAAGERLGKKVLNNFTFSFDPIKRELSHFTQSTLEKALAGITAVVLEKFIETRVASKQRTPEEAPAFSFGDQIH